MNTETTTPFKGSISTGHHFDIFCNLTVSELVLKLYTFAGCDVFLCFWQQQQQQFVIIINREITVQCEKEHTITLTGGAGDYIPADTGQEIAQVTNQRQAGCGDRQPDASADNLESSQLTSPA